MGGALRSKGPSRGTRIEIIDALRGLAMMGIILVNFPSINTIPGKEAVRYSFISSPFDEFMASLNMHLFNGKVYPIFAMLFGLGMAIFMQQRTTKGDAATLLMRRRLGFLALFGLLHITLVWWGDILLIYATLGFAALGFYQMNNRRLGSWIILSMWAAPAVQLLFQLIAPAALSTNLRLWRFSAEPDEAIHHIYQHAPFFAVAKERIFNYLDYALPIFRSDLYDFIMVVGYYGQIFALILFGLLLGRNRWHIEDAAQKVMVDKLWQVGLWGFAVYALSHYYPSKLAECFFYPLKSLVAFFYVLSFVKAYRYPWFQSFANFFTPVGKISMTVYLTHTTAASLLLYGYGLGYYGNSGPGFVIAIAVALALVMTIFAQLWVKKFNFGPFEWLWRGATYGKFPALLIPPAATLARRNAERETSA